MQWLLEFNYIFWISVQVVSSSKQQLKKKNRFKLCFSKLTQNRVVKKFKQGKQKIYIDELMDETMKMKFEKHTSFYIRMGLTGLKYLLSWVFKLIYLTFCKWNATAVLKGKIVSYTPYAKR